jgi:large subunit ribosomal protein L13
VENDAQRLLCNKKAGILGFWSKFPLTGHRPILLFTAFPKIMKTTLATKSDHTKTWDVVDAANETLGRIAVKIANVLRGRHKPTYTPHADTGDFVVVVNAEKIKVSGKKNSDKRYMFYSGWMGGESYVSMSDMRAKKPEFIIEHAVKGMLPRNKLGRQMIKKLKIHAGAEHPYEAQQPKPLV